MMSERPPEQTATAESPGTPTAIGRVGRRWSRWAGNLLVSGLIVVIGLTFGRQLVQWMTDDADPPPAPPVALNNDFTHDLQFGELPFAFRDTQFVGDQDAAFAKLRESCGEAVRREVLPSHEPRAAEMRLLDSLQRKEPVDRQPGQWAIYQLEGPILMVVATREIAGSADGEHVAAVNSRVVSWGLGVPDADSNWLLFTYAVGAGPGDSPAGFPALPVPPGSRRTMSLNSVSGGTLVGFVGAGPASDWRRFYDQWFAERRWAAEIPWRQESAVWQARFVKPGSGRVDVQLVDDGATMTGMLTATRSDIDDR